MQSKSKEQIRGGVTFQQANAEQFADGGGVNLLMCTHWQFPCLQGYWSERNNKKNIQSKGISADQLTFM